MAKHRKTDTNGQPEDNTGFDENQTEVADMENPEIDETQNDVPAGDSKPSEDVPEELDTLLEPSEPTAPVTSFTSEDEQDAIALLFNRVMGHDSMPDGWTLQNSTKIVRDAWANSKHGRPYPGYSTALFELTKDL